MASRPHDRVVTTGGGRPESIGALLTRSRLARGFSQLRVAERLCAVSGLPTVSRHEISRWEREDRIPGAFWLSWLAVVLDVPLEELEAAVAVARVTGADQRPADHRMLWRPPTVADLLAELDQAAGHDIRELAHAWLAGPTEPPPQLVSPGVTGRFEPVTMATEPLDELEARLVDDRRHDDLIGGVYLATRVDREVRAAIGLFGTLRGDSVRRRALRLVADYAQLAGWVHTDAGNYAAARRAYRLALRAATAGADRPAAAHVLGSLSHLSLTNGDPQEALLLARTGHAGVRGEASGRTQALLLHRVALAAARAGERRTAYRAIADAERAVESSDPAQEPRRLYWVDPGELSAMTGRCWAVLGRPLRAIRLLAAPRRGVGPRTAAIYGTWLARCYTEVGEHEQAARVAWRATREAVRAGSARAAGELRRLHPTLLRHRYLPAVRAYEHLVAAAEPRLPAPAGRGRPGGARRATGGVRRDAG
jgi:transcriptional regulator with XRE-family HTH domain